MSLLKKICFFTLLGGYFFVTPVQTGWFLWEDLGLDIYENIDQWLAELEIQQYQYELEGQGESSIWEVVGQLLAEEWVECEIETINDIEEIVSWPAPIWAVALKCFEDGESLWTQSVVRIQNRLSEIKDTFRDRAENKSQKIYEIARIWLYSDGSDQNSPFDLIHDLQEIDRVIFSQEIEYNGEEFAIDDQKLSEFLTEDKSYLRNRRGWDEEDNIWDEENWEEKQEDILSPIDPRDLPPFLSDLGHEYACLPEDESGLSENPFVDIPYVFKWDDRRNPRRDIPVIEDWFEVITDGEFSNWASWGGPFPGVALDGQYSGTTNPWKCESFFCIIVEFSTKNQQLLGGGQTISIMSLLSRANEHFDVFANTSLVQSKHTTNNFELGLIIPNLGDLLRGFGIQVQTKPAPILSNIEWSSDADKWVEWDLYTAKNLHQEYYKNIGLDYGRSNDLDIHRSRANQQKALQECSELAATCPTDKLSELSGFKSQLAESNEIVSLAVEKYAATQDSSEFYTQFVELERFVKSIEDFSYSLAWIVKAMRKIPTRKS